MSLLFPISGLNQRSQDANCLLGALKLQEECHTYPLELFLDFLYSSQA